MNKHVFGVFASVMMVTTVFAEGKYMVIDVSGGANAAKYPVTYLDAEPESGWTDEYKTDKIVLCKVPAGTYARRVRIKEYPFISANEKDVEVVRVSKSFYFGVFPITQRQWEFVMGDRPSWYKSDDLYAKRPVEKVSYDSIRGRKKGAMYPESREVDGNSFLGIIRERTGVTGLDIPTEDMWEYACRAGVNTEYNGGENNSVSMLELGRYAENSGGRCSSRNAGKDQATSTVGTYRANRFGIYDTHGNVCEWCLDFADPNDRPEMLSPLSLGKNRICKGGFHESSSPLCAASIGYSQCSSIGSTCTGFRLCSF